MQALQAVQAVLEVQEYEKAIKRIPEHLKYTAPYSVNTLWTYYNRTYQDPVGESCNYCKMFDGQTFTGDQLRTVFPDHKWVGDDIYPNVHMTLWGKESTCSCLLIREDEKWGPDTNLNLWSQVGTDWTEQPKDEESTE